MNYDGRGLIAQQIAEWIRTKIILLKPGRGKCFKLVVRHLNIDRKPQGDVDTIMVPTDEGLAGEVDMLVNQIVDAAQKDADDIKQGIQNYAVYAYFQNDKNDVPRKIFRVAAEEEMERDISPSEPPTEKGLVSQLMRHNEAVSKTAYVAMTTMFGNFERQIGRLSEMNEKFAAQQVDMMVLVQDTLNEAHTRRMSEKKNELSMALQEGAFEQLKAVAPIIINRLAGKPILPEPDKSFMLLAQLLENLTPDQQAMLRDTLSPPQLAILGEILGDYESKKQKYTPKTTNKEVAGNALPTDIPGKFLGSSEDSSDPVVQALETTAKQMMNRLKNTGKK